MFLVELFIHQVKIKEIKVFGIIIKETNINVVAPRGSSPCHFGPPRPLLDKLCCCCCRQVAATCCRDRGTFLEGCQPEEVRPGSAADGAVLVKVRERMKEWMNEWMNQCLAGRIRWSFLSLYEVSLWNVDPTWPLTSSGRDMHCKNKILTSLLISTENISVHFK